MDRKHFFPEKTSELIFLSLKYLIFLSPRKLTVVHSRPGWWWSGVDRRVDQLPSATLFNYLFIKLYN
jgi:hypothetical protein